MSKSHRGIKGGNVVLGAVQWKATLWLRRKFEGKEVYLFYNHLHG
jgi:hypothetical protein